MKSTKSFFKREAVFTAIFQAGLPLLGLLLVLITLFWRWLLH
jgi:hypothetical protein